MEEVTLLKTYESNSEELVEHSDEDDELIVN